MRAAGSALSGAMGQLTGVVTVVGVYAWPKCHRCSGECQLCLTYASRRACGQGMAVRLDRTLHEFYRAAICQIVCRSNIPCYSCGVDNIRARGELLQALRLSRGLKQTQVAELTGISQATLSKLESGDAVVEEGKWETLADALHVPPAVFTEITESTAPVRTFHRKAKTTPKTAVNKVEAELALARLRVKHLVGPRPVTVHAHDLEGGFVTPQEVAASVREELGVGDGPIDNLVGLLEGAGAVVLRWPLDAIQVSAVAAWQEGDIPVILVGEHVPADRQRFTMAHELGHAVMHETEATAEQEAEADAFAAEFILPADKLRSEWPAHWTLENLIPLKRRWGISLSALVRRAFDVDLISEHEYRRANIELSTTGMHRREPEPTEREVPRVLGNAIRQASDDGISVEELARRAYMYPSEFQHTFLQETD